MRDRHKIFEGLKNTPEGWRFCNCLNKEASFAGDQYDTPYTLEEVLDQKGNGVGVLLGGHSTTTINGKKYGLGAVANALSKNAAKLWVDCLLVMHSIASIRMPQ